MLSDTVSLCRNTFEKPLKAHSLVSYLLTEGCPGAGLRWRRLGAENP